MLSQHASKKSLPPEMLVEILSYLQGTDLQHCMLVNKTWYRFIRSYLLEEKEAAFLNSFLNSNEIQHYLTCGKQASKNGVVQLNRLLDHSQRKEKKHNTVGQMANHTVRFFSQQENERNLSYIIHRAAFSYSGPFIVLLLISINPWLGDVIFQLKEQCRSEEELETAFINGIAFFLFVTIPTLMMGYVMARCHQSLAIETSCLKPYQKALKTFLKDNNVTVTTFSSSEEIYETIPLPDKSDECDDAEQGPIRFRPFV